MTALSRAHRGQLAHPLIPQHNTQYTGGPARARRVLALLTLHITRVLHHVIDVGLHGGLHGGLGSGRALGCAIKMLEGTGCSIGVRDGRSGNQSHGPGLCY